LAPVAGTVEGCVPRGRPFAKQHRLWLRCPAHLKEQIRRAFHIVRKRIDHRAFVVTFICPEGFAANECVDLATVKFDRKTRKRAAVASGNDAFGLRRFSVRPRF
jgi:hypothetical protein